MSSDLTQQRHVWDARASKVVHLSDGTHCLLRWRIWEAVKVKDVGTSGWDWRNLTMSIVLLLSLGLVLVYPGWVKLVFGGFRGFNTWRLCNGVIGRSRFGLAVIWAHACKNCDVPIPSHRQWLIAVHRIIPPQRRFVTWKKQIKIAAKYSQNIVASWGKHWWLI